ncbi:hypothetical protein P3X46_030007 [Hevea brasiliensis]|uniref:F-box domain-containing protein n=1 Tax=Hevea brasiliensis TaxID=3981 RepID=A0ABQ9KU07_HEVBR|nr:hypothetical protein P3X46_030007 [Hevea brasiliensis]
MENKRCKCLASSRKWANMNYDILVKIFMMLSTMDLVSSISLVCPSWRVECCHPMLCHTPDLARLNYSVDNPRDLFASLDNWPRLSLAQALDSALILSGTNVMRLIFHLHAHITDERLIFAAERCPRLKRLVLPAWNHISANGFCAAIQKLKELRSLTLPCNYFPTKILQTIGINCPKLTKLKVMCPFDHDFANTLFIYFPNLKALSVRCTIVHKDALRLTLMLFDDLDVLNITHSLLMDFNPSEGPTIFKCESDKSIAEQASKLKAIFWRQTESCIMCQRVHNDLGRPKWNEYEEGLGEKTRKVLLQFDQVCCDHVCDV